MDNVRNMTGSPIAGIDPHELLDIRPLNYGERLLTLPCSPRFSMLHLPALPLSDPQTNRRWCTRHIQHSHTKSVKGLALAHRVESLQASGPSESMVTITDSLQAFAVLSVIVRVLTADVSWLEHCRGLLQRILKKRSCSRCYSVA